VTLPQSVDYGIAHIIRAEGQAALDASKRRSLDRGATPQPGQLAKMGRTLFEVQRINREQRAAVRGRPLTPGEYTHMARWESPGG